MVSVTEIQTKVLRNPPRRLIGTRPKLRSFLVLASDRKKIMGIRKDCLAGEQSTGVLTTQLSDFGQDF